MNFSKNNIHITNLVYHNEWKLAFDTEQVQWKAHELSLRNYKYAFALLPNFFPSSSQLLPSDFAGVQYAARILIFQTLGKL